MTVHAPRLTGRTALVTGGASGIGRATVFRLLEEGASVVFSDVNLDTGTATLREAREAFDPDRVRFFPGDAASEADVEHAVGFVRETFGRIDCLAGCAGTGGALTGLLDTSLDHWDPTQELLGRSVFLGLKHVGRAMVEQGQGGSVVNVSSVAALAGGHGSVALLGGQSGCVELGHDSRRGAGPIPHPRQHGLTGGHRHAVVGARRRRGTDACSLHRDPALAGGGRGRRRGGLRRVPAERRCPVCDRCRFGGRRVVLITGATRGFGKALAERLAGMGHSVVGCGRNREAVQGMNRRFGQPHRFEVVDVASDGAVGRWVDDLERAGLVPDLVINNAALTNAPTQLWRLDHEEIEAVLRVNVVGTMNVLRHVVPRIFRRRSGILVNFSSGWGREAAARTSAYCASKWAVEGLTRALAAELPGGMAVVAVHPGIVRTDTMARGFGEAADRYPSPAEWALVAAPYLLGIAPGDNGRSLSVPGMTAFHGMGRVPSRHSSGKPPERGGEAGSVPDA